MTNEQSTPDSDKAEALAPGATDATSASDAKVLDLAKRLKAVVAELETGVTEPGDLMTPSEKLRAIADLIDRRAATAAPPTAGLPGRRLLNDVFVALAVEAGTDSGILDPVGADPARLFGMDRSSRAWSLAANLLTGRDPYGIEYLMAIRAGELVA